MSDQLTPTIVKNGLEEYTLDAEDVSKRKNINNKEICIDFVVESVYLNLKYFLNWQNVKIYKICNSNVNILSGLNTALGKEDAAPQREYVFPVHIKSKKVTDAILYQIYTEIAPVNFFHLGILSEDGTVVYYRVHKGLQKPQK
ncbi:uncharacterized protein SCODWIG_02400 [Saccharomycodes ludwigii]|uniref:tRNA-splicing endonuclease subunit Sen15 domain-containing protein n=1 Tax=Saccharomycodes ludwigii TaxID=36035 RepID=A0A376B7U2_9ASCO|nr:hypothetical protein SCDLUD_004068 [Saccharomycodes ludwigii]KAH3899778.1 hypothetical protein SCDLUD_004068 [Saccharomycodes ludwigii]SSD60639.1 uncharacterized protein SCODWIG_02400 [Saccharomycodes ludwigii]